MRETVTVRTFSFRRVTSRSAFRLVVAGVVALLLALSASAVMATGSVGAVVTTRSKSAAIVRQKATTTRKRVTTRKPTTVKRVTTRSVAIPTAVATLPTTSSPTSAAPVIPTVAPTNPPISVVPVAFERSTYTLTAATDTNYEVRFFINIAPGFNDTLVMRTTPLPIGVQIGFEPNPARNFFAMTLRISASAPPSAEFDITASASSAPGAVLARTSIKLFANSTTLLPTSQPPIGDPALPPGVVYTVSPTLVEVLRGGDTTVKVDFFRQGGFAGPVTFSMVSALPAGLGTSFQVNPATGSVNYLFVSAGASTTPGTYVLDFEAITAIQRTPLRAVVVVK